MTTACKELTGYAYLEWKRMVNCKHDVGGTGVTLDEISWWHCAGCGSLIEMDSATGRVLRVREPEILLHERHRREVHSARWGGNGKREKKGG